MPRAPRLRGPRGTLYWCFLVLKKEEEEGGKDMKILNRVRKEWERGIGAERERKRTGKKGEGPRTWHVPWAPQHGDPALSLT